MAKRVFFSPGFRQWAYKVSGFNKYGLMKDDLLNEDLAEVQEALRRIPQYVRDERNFRIIRAMQLDCQKKILPVEQWTKYEEEVSYLRPIVDDVLKEWKEKEDWENSH